MLKLYDIPLSPYAQKVKIALREKGIEFTASVPEGLGGGGASGAFAMANPRAEVPVLIDREVSIFDSTIILEYLEDRWPTPALLPAGAAARAKVRMIEEVMDTHFEPVNWGLAEINWFSRATGELASALKARAAAQTRGFFTWLERELTGADWFNGPAFGWGDLCVVPFVAGAAASGNSPAEGSSLAAWLARALARPSVEKTVGEARTFNVAGLNLGELLKTGLFKREYRDHRLEWMIKSGGIDVVVKGLEAGNIRFTPDFG